MVDNGFMSFQRVIMSPQDTNIFLDAQNKRGFSMNPVLLSSQCVCLSMFIYFYLVLKVVGDSPAYVQKCFIF